MAAISGPDSDTATTPTAISSSVRTGPFSSPAEWALWHARPVTWPADADGELTHALVAELARKTAVCWLRYEGSTHAVWHVWSDGSLCLVSAGTEQPLPRLADGEGVEVLMRSKNTGGLLLTWAGTVSVVRPEDEAWAPTTAALLAARLNLPDPATAAERWATDSQVLRITPRLLP